MRVRDAGHRLSRLDRRHATRRHQRTLADHDHPRRAAPGTADDPRSGLHVHGGALPDARFRAPGDRARRSDHLVRSAGDPLRKIKNDPSRPHEHWWIIEPIAEALAVAERLSWHDSYVFASLKAPDEQRQSGRRGFPASAGIDFFIAGINQTAASTGLEPIPSALVRPHMFRRTMAVICGQEPDAEIALGLQLKHAARRALANRTTAGYYAHVRCPAFQRLHTL